MGIAEEQVSAHAAHLLQREQPKFVEPVVHQRGAVRARGQHGHQADEVAWETRPQSGRDASGADQLAGAHAEHIVVLRAIDVHLAQHAGHDFHVHRPRAANLDFPAGDGADHRPAASLDVVAVETLLRAAEAHSAFHANRVRALAGDADAHAAQELAELHDVRLAGGVTDLGHAGRGGRRQQRRLGARDRRFVEVDRGRTEPIWHLQTMARALDDLGAHRGERLDVGADAPPRREVAPGRRDVRLTAPGQERPQQQNRPAQPSDQGAVGLVLQDIAALDAQRGAADALDLGAEIEQQPRHDLDVGDSRHVGQHARLIRQQAGCHQRQRRVLVAFDVDASAEPTAAVNDECGHGRDQGSGIGDQGSGDQESKA